MEVAEKIQRSMRDESSRIFFLVPEEHHAQFRGDGVVLIVEGEMFVLRTSAIEKGLIEA